jgi:hypothetical protein
MVRKTKQPAAPTITSIKGFGADMVCSGPGYRFQYEIGKTYTHDGTVKACKSGFHAYPVEEHPLNVFNSYAPAGSRFFEVDQSGETSRENAKLASAVITVKFELSISDLVKRAFDYVWSRCTLTEGSSATGYRGAASATGYRGAASATGDQGAASATGDQGAASATGDQGAASATGDQGAASATGYRGAASATGDQGAASATGDQGAASATGYRGAASATGYRGAASATGYRGAASATGYRGAASATGDWGAASATGDWGAASATGDWGAASATGRGCGAYATGFDGRVSGNDGSPLHLDERLFHPGHDDHGKVLAVWAGIVGQGGIKPGTFYTLKGGQPVEAD